MASHLQKKEPLGNNLSFSEPCAAYADFSYSTEGFEAAVQKLYEATGNPKKHLPLHSYVAHVLAGIWGEPFRICYKGDNSKEMTVEGKYYSKDIDVTVVSKEGKPVFCLGIKFVCSNYKKDNNNYKYFEEMMGETANIQALGNTPYAQLIILRYKTPYYKKNESGKASKIETINDDDIRKYVRLIFDDEQAHRPRYIGIQFVDINESTGETKLSDLKMCSTLQGTANLLLSQLSLPRFFSNIKEYHDFFVAVNQ